MKSISMSFLIFILLLEVVYAMPPQQLDQQSPYNCTNETTPLQITIIELNNTLTEILTNLSYYQNLSEYYKFLYETKEVNITHGELIQIFNTLNQLNFNYNQTNQTINEIKQEFTKYKLDVTICAVSASILGFSILEIILWGFKKWRKRGQQNESAS